MMSNKYDSQLMDALGQLEQEKPLETQQTQAEQNERISQMALAKIRQEAAPENNKQIYLSEQKPPKAVRHRPLRAGLIVAALFCVLGVSVCAAGVTLLPMLTEKINFFENAPSQGEVDNAANAPRGEHDGQQTLERFNAPVGQTVTNNGVTVTLDNVSMDIAGLDLFFTIEGQEAIDEMIAKNDHMPLWDVLGRGSVFFDVALNGTPLVRSVNADDWYQGEDGSLKLMIHALLPQLPEGDELMLQVNSQSVLDREGSWSFTVPLDGNSVRAGGKIGNAGVYSLPAEPAQDDVPEISKDLDLIYLAFGPRGGVMMTRNNYWEVLGDNDYPLYSGDDGSVPSDFMVTDDTGKVLFVSTESSYAVPNDDAEYFAADLTLPDPAATSITLTPMEWIGNEGHTFTTEELKKGVESPCGPESGYFIKNFAQEGSSLSWQEVPYGYGPYWVEVIPDDDDLITMVGGRSGLISYVYDPYTGIFNCRLDYYAATPEEVASIENWSVPCSNYRPDREHAITIPLKALDDAK